MNTPVTENLDPLAQKSKAWSGRFSEPVADFVLRYTASVDFDKRMAMQDITGCRLRQAYGYARHHGFRCPRHNAQ